MRVGVENLDATDIDQGQAQAQGQGHGQGHGRVDGAVTSLSDVMNPAAAVSALSNPLMNGVALSELCAAICLGYGAAETRSDVKAVDGVCVCVCERRGAQ